MDSGDDRTGGPQGYVFAVAERPHCCWDFDHNARTLEFLDGLDTDHFKAVASLFAEQVECSDDPFPASVALRISYHQGLETLFSLLGATAQAPGAVPAWIANCTTDDLKEIVSGLRDGRSMLTQAGTERVSFLGLSELVHRFAWPKEQGDASTAAKFGRFWRRLSSEFLDETSRAEYNALKHGSRVLPGGFSLAIGTEETPGIPASPDVMRSLGGSEFGSTFFVAERVGDAKHHIRTRRTSVNWTPLSLAQRLVLVSMSITNVVGALRCWMGIEPSSVQFFRPDPPSAFETVWEREPSVRSTGLDASIRIDPSDELTKDELREILEQRGARDGEFVDPDPSSEG